MIRNSKPRPDFLFEDGRALKYTQCDEWRLPSFSFFCESQPACLIARCLNSGSLSCSAAVCTTTRSQSSLSVVNRGTCKPLFRQKYWHTTVYETKGTRLTKWLMGSDWVRIMVRVTYRIVHSSDPQPPSRIPSPEKCGKLQASWYKLP